MINRWIPFRLLPASWGLMGRAYTEAEAYYTLDGEALERRLLQLRCDDADELLGKLIEVDLRHGHITAYDAAKRRVELTQPPGVEFDLKMLAIEHEFHKISETAYHKQRAILKQEPWISIVNSGFDPEQGIDGVFFEFDWNTQWIEFLRVNGYVGHSDEQVVDDWFADVCRSHGQISDPLVPFSMATRAS